MQDRKTRNFLKFFINNYLISFGATMRKIQQQTMM